MSISYSAINGFGSGKATLPSVDSWGTNMNILRDPSKSIMTRRIDKVGQNSSITELIDESGDRARENISVYARGVNPFVSVDYGNFGNNGGQNSGGFGGVSKDIGSSGNRFGGGQAYLPYRIVKDGEFRPPVVAPFNLLAQSRMPRLNTDVFTQPGAADYSKKLQQPDGTYREIKDDTLKCSIHPTAIYRIDAPLVEPFEVKYVIKNPVKFDKHAGKSGIRTQDLTIQDVKEPTKEINTTPLYAEDVFSNLSGETLRYVDNSHMNTDPYIQDTLHSSVQSKMSQSIHIDNSNKNTDPYIQDTLHSSVQSKPSRSIQITPIEDIFDVDIRTKDAINISYTPIKTGYTKEDHIHNDVELQRRVLAVTMATNKHRDIHSRPEYEYQAEQKRNRPIAEATTNVGTIQRQSLNDLNSREYTLKPTISAGEFSGRGQMPLQGMNYNVKLADSHQQSRNRTAIEMNLTRN